MASAKRHFKFAAVWVVSILVVGALGFTAWFAYHSEQVADQTLKSANKVSNDVPKTPAIISFDDCKKAAGSTMLQTYPEQCVTKAGKTFTDTAAQKTLAIKEWGVQLPYTGTDTLSYKMGTPDNTLRVISQNLATQYGCTTLGGGVINREAGWARDGMSNTGQTIAQSYAKDPSGFTKVGSYYYRFVHDQAACSDNLTSAATKAQNAANDFVKGLVPSLTAIK